MKLKLRHHMIMHIAAVVLLFLIMALSGCTTPLTPSREYLCPDFIAGETYNNILQTTPIQRLEETELQQQCGADYYVVGCTEIDKGKATIFVVEGISEREVINHEVCHVYRALYRGIAMSDEVRHVGWTAGSK